AVPIESNAKGVILMGIEGEGKSYKEMVGDGMSAIYAIGELPISKRPKTDFLVVQNSHLTDIAKQADVVLPSAAFLEASGTIVDYMGRLKYLCKAIEPAGQSMSHREILMAVAKAVGKDIKEPKDADVKKALKAKPKVSLKPFKKKGGLDVNPQEMIESINASVINGSRLLWLKESEKAMAGV
ncbi:MAG: molybdopterin-dependent oxidoreductase, partial [Nitrospirae bacterium]|nr:molybdopterin-dependent oxidoreductase [Nitrospirota bacterium]